MGKPKNDIAKTAQLFHQQCHDAIKKFVSRVGKGTNRYTEVFCDSKKQYRVPSIIDDEASDSSTQHTNESNGIDSEDEHQESCENENALECYIHPHNKRSNSSKQDSKISFEGLTIYDHQTHDSAKAALFMYWPRGISSSFYI